MRRAFALTLGLLAAGCGDELSNAVFDDDARFLAAVPRAAFLRVGGADEDGVRRAALSEEGLAPYYVATRRATLDLDRAIVGHLRQVEALVAEGPAVRDGDRRVWGPFRHALDPLESRFVVDRTDDDTYAYALEMATVGTEDRAATITGAWTGEAPGEGRGEIVFDLDALARLTGSASRGRLEAAYARRGDESIVWLELVDFAEAPDAPRRDLSAAWRRHPGGGELEFGYTDRDTLVGVRSRWRSDGAGRADARAEADPPVDVTECWDASFRLVYAAVGARSEGDPATCAFAERELPGKIAAP